MMFSNLKFEVVSEKHLFKARMNPDTKPPGVFCGGFCIDPQNYLSLRSKPFTCSLGVIGRTVGQDADDS